MAQAQLQWPAAAYLFSADHAPFLPLLQLTFSNCSHTLALAADQHAGHAMSNFASVGERGIGSVPARVIGIVSGGPAPALVTLPARAAMQHDLMRTRRPIFIDIKFCRLRRRRGSLRDEPRIHCDLLQLRSRVPAHG